MRIASIQRRAVRRHLEDEVGVAGEADFRPARPAALEEQRGGVAVGLLVDDEADVAGAAVGRLDAGEQHRLAAHRQPVGGVGGGVDAELVDRRRQAADRHPAASLVHQQHTGGASKASQPCSGVSKSQAPSTKARQLAVVAGPVAGAARGNDVAVALAGDWPADRSARSR